MKSINLRYVYPEIYKCNYYVKVTNEVYYLLKHNNYIESDYHKIIFFEETLFKVEEPFYDEGLIKVLYHYLGILPLKQQNRIYERYFLDLKYVDIARIERCSEAAIRKSINRGIAELKKKIFLYYLHRGWENCENK